MKELFHLFLQMQLFLMLLQKFILSLGLRERRNFKVLILTQPLILEKPTNFLKQVNNLTFDCAVFPRG